MAGKSYTALRSVSAVLYAGIMRLSQRQGIMNKKLKNFTFSSDSTNLDIEFITSFLKNSYWAKGRKREKVSATIKNSFCIGVFLKKEQIGFARVVTDYETHAYIMDVFISPDYQGRGLGKELMNCLVNAPELSKICRFSLCTVDAREFYLSLGFESSNKLLIMDR
ncbi:GNAT family N-acetyltransferase [Gammaproteobacteria bacterium]|nr:GNAT family N-acetyltransferase [Gammaproteobacteria bacterium]